MNYRLDREHQYPTPVHDVLAGYDWIQEHLLPRRAISRTGRSAHTGRVAVCGELVGSGLATMLAVTECRLGQPGVVAAAISNPIVDWVDLEESVDSVTLPPSSTSMEEQMKDASGLMLGIRKQVFRKPEHYFDPFASPLIFFRSPGRDVPPLPSNAPLDDMEHLAFLEREDFHRQQLALSAISFMALEDAAEDEESKARRMTSKGYPSSALGLRLPAFHISAGAASPLQGQASELTKRLRQSFVRQATASDFGRKVLMDDEIEQMDDEERAERQARDAEARAKAQLRLGEDMGLWDDSKAGQGRVMEVVRWLREKLT